MRPRLVTRRIERALLARRETCARPVVERQREQRVPRLVARDLAERAAHALALGRLGLHERDERAECLAYAALGGVVACDLDERARRVIAARDVARLRTDASCERARDARVAALVVRGRARPAREPRRRTVQRELAGEILERVDGSRLQAPRLREPTTDLAACRTRREEQR